MKESKIYIFIFLFFFSGIFVFAQSEEKKQNPVYEIKQEIPEGMEAVQIGGSAQLIIPKGAKTKKVGAQIIVEGTKEYMSRRFSEIDAQIEQIKKTQEAITEELKTLSDAIKNTQDNANIDKSNNSAKTPEANK